MSLLVIAGFLALVFVVGYYLGPIFFDDTPDD